MTETVSSQINGRVKAFYNMGQENGIGRHEPLRAIPEFFFGPEKHAPHLTLFWNCSSFLAVHCS
jgi:hypothetical protein